MNNPRFLIVSPYNSSAHPPDAPSYAEIARITSKSIIDYCESWGYDYYITDENPSKRAISWDKPFLAYKFLNESPETSYIWTIDIDVFLLNYNISLESIVDNNHDVFFTCYKNDINFLNTGSIIYRNTAWTRNFLKQILEDTEFIEPRPNCFFEQDSIKKFYLNNPNEQSHFCFLNTRTINSHFHSGLNHLGINYVHGEDLACHTAGTDNFFRLETFKKLQNWIIKKGESPREGFDVGMWNK